MPSSSASASRTERTFLSAAVVELKASDITTAPVTTSDDDDDDDDESVTFPPPLSQLDRLKRAAVFWSKAVPIVANYYGLIGSLKLQEIMGETLDEETIEVCTKVAAESDENESNYCKLTFALHCT